MNDELTYEDFLRRIDIQDLLQDAGYRQNRKDGLRWPVYQRYEGNDRVHGDKFIVTSNGMCCFRPAVYKNYNVISFIKNFPELFADYKPGQNLDALVFDVCNRMLNNPRPVRIMGNATKEYHHKPFDLSNYEVRHLDPKDGDSIKAFDRFFAQRGINHDTQEAFKKHFILAAKHREDGKSYANLSFPLSIPGKEGIVGLEERGIKRPDGSSYKGKAQNSNGSEGLWIANLSGQSLEKVQKVLWFESSYDAMAQFQLDGAKDYEPKGVYVSTGGNPTIMQMRGMLAATPNARHYVGFDKDIAGMQFLANFRSIADDMGIRKDHIIANQPLGYYKDWNDALQGKKTMTLKDVTIDYDYNMEPIHDEDKRPNKDSNEEVVLNSTFHR